LKTRDQAWKLRDLIPDTELYPKVESDFKTKRLAITSGKGGVGKSVISVNFALLLAQDNYKTLLVDGDINLSKIPILTDTAPKYSYTDVKRGEKKLTEVIYDYQDNCSILPTGSGALELVNSEDDFKFHFTQQFKQLNGIYDHMIVDTASGISSLVFGELASCDEILVVITPEPTSVADAYAVIKIMSFYYPQIPIHIIYNLVESENEAYDSYKKFDLIVQKFLRQQVNYLGFLYYDDNVTNSIKEQTPLALTDSSSSFVMQLLKIKNRWLESSLVSQHSVVNLQN